jgi:threonine dehydratase
MSTQAPSFQDVLAARRAVYAHLSRTPLHRYRGLADLVGAEVWVKHEDHHPVGAFKVRGGLNLVARLSPEERRAGLYTASTGNHGQSLAFAGRVSGTRVTVAAPQGANPSKVAAMRALGAEVVLHGRDFDEAREWIRDRAKREGARFVGPADPELIAGVATYALEIVEDLPDVEVIVVPVGVGSGAAGVCLAARTLNPAIRVIAVQSERAPAVQQTWRQGRPVEAPMETRAEGLATRVPFEITQRILRDPTIGLEDFVLVSDEALDRAILLLLEHAQSLELRERLAGRRVVLVLSGRNLSMAALRGLLGAPRGG